MYTVGIYTRCYQCLDDKLFQPVGTCPIGLLLLHYNETVKWRGRSRVCGRGSVGKVKVVAGYKRADGQGLSTLGGRDPTTFEGIFPKS